MNRYAAFSISIIAAIAGFIVALWLLDDRLQAALFGLFVLALYALSRRIWLPPGYGVNLVRLASIAVASAILIPTPFWVTLIAENWQVISPYLPAGLVVPPGLYQVSGASTLGAVAIVFIVNYFMREREPILPVPDTSSDKDFPEKSYKQKLNSVAGALERIITGIDYDLNWSAEYYTPLDAEVEVRGQRKSIMTLLESIGSDKVSRTFLILGDPGSGKSCALRKLALDMLKETDRTGKLPIYINLKEWVTDHPWTREQPPSSEQLMKFVVEKASRKDHAVHDFFSKYFERMLEHGRLFFLFDSFDEIPQVLDEEESSWLIDDLSRLFLQFIGGAHESRGVLTSRQFRSPTKAFRADKVLEIRPFSDAKIRDAFTKLAEIDPAAVTRLFQQRPDWVSIARNPFNASLMATYFRVEGNKIPDSQAALFRVYLSHRLAQEGCVARMKEKGVTEAELLDFCVAAAMTIYEDPDLGLEVSVARLSEQLGPDVMDRFNVLDFARIARISEDKAKASFVHRRFTEYFISRHFVAHPDQLQLDVIPMDSSGRDGLIMYCETAPTTEAARIAKFCWGQVQEGVDLDPAQNVDAYRRSVLSLRFLGQAFRSSPECLEEFREELSSWLLRTIRVGDRLKAKHALEATGLLQERELELAVVSAMRRENPWLTETSIRACRHLGSIGTDLVARLVGFINTLERRDLRRTADELDFSFGLSQAFIPVRRYLKYRLMSDRMTQLGLVLCFVASPSLFAIGWLYFAFLGARAPSMAVLGASLQPTRYFGLLMVPFLLLGKTYSWVSLLRKPSANDGLVLSLKL